MAGAVKLKVTVTGHKELMQKLRADKTLAPPLRAAYEEIGQIGVQAARSAAPVGPSGNTRALMAYRVMGKAIATAVSIRSTATRTSPKRRRYPYPKRVAYASRHKGWLTHAIGGAMGRVQSILRATEGKIRSQWQT